MSTGVDLPAGEPGTPYRLCFICTGNICRSPMAEVVVRHLAADVPLGPGSLAERLEVSSAGTGPWHEGEPMDPRARAALAAVGYADHGHIAHQFRVEWFDRFDLLVALDRRHLQTLRSLAGDRPLDGRLVLLRSFDARAGGAVDVPDPYYGDAREFAACLALVEAGCRELVAALAARIPAPEATGRPPDG